VAVDETRHGDATGGIDLLDAVVLVVGADDPVIADRDVAFDQIAGDEIENAGALEDQIGTRTTERLIDPPFQSVPCVAHGQQAFSSTRRQGS